MGWAKRWTEAQLVAALQRRYRSSEWALIPQVRNAAGFDANRTADALALNLWPSRGLALHGFEIKITRGDWIRELAAPAKADAIARYCDYWWVVVPSAEIVQEGELPEGWGLLAIKGQKLRAVQEAAKRAAEPLDRSFIAAILKRANSALLQNVQIDAAKEEAYARGVEAGKSAEQREADGDHRGYEDLKTFVARFEEAAGVEIRHWRAGDVGAAVRVVIEGRTEQHQMTLRSIRTQAQRVVAAIDGAAS